MSPRSWTSFPPLSQPQSIINMIDFINIKTLFLMCCAVLNCSVVSNSLHPMDCSHPGSCVHGDSPGKNTGAVATLYFRGSFQPRDRGQVSPIAGGFHQGSRRILEWVSHPFSGNLTTRNLSGVSWIPGRFFTSWATREALCFSYLVLYRKLLSHLFIYVYHL